MSSTNNDNYNNNNNKCNHKNISSKFCIEQRLALALENRRQLSTLRSLELISSSSSSSSSKVEQRPQQPQPQQPTPSIDFSSNDYLGLAHLKEQLHNVEKSYYHNFIKNNNPPYLGSTGSRLLSGNSNFILHLEEKIARIHASSSSSSSRRHHHHQQHRGHPSALLFNSGYDANLSLISSIPMKNDYILMDELVHNSLIMGVKMSRMLDDHILHFQHNNINDLEEKLMLLSHLLDEQNIVFHNNSNNNNNNSSSNENDIQNDDVLMTRGQIIIIVESVYSMDGDIAPLEDILNLALVYNAKVIVDEAHGLGVFGKTNISDLYGGKDNKNKMMENEETDKQKDDKSSLSNDSSIIYGGTGVLAALDLEYHPSLLAAVYTFGKAAGCHGAVVISKDIVKEYLINYARPFVYSTSLPPHSLCTIECAYDTMTNNQGEILRQKVFNLVRLFRTSIQNEFGRLSDDILFNSVSPIQSIMCRGNKRCVDVVNMLRKMGPFNLFPIRSPTVPKGEERIRVIIHAHNSEREVKHLVQCLCIILKERDCNKIHSLSKL